MAPTFMRREVDGVVLAVSTETPSRGKLCPPHTDVKHPLRLDFLPSLSLSLSAVSKKSQRREREKARAVKSRIERERAPKTVADH